MDLESQEAISGLAEKHGTDELLVLIGAPDPQAAEVSAETVVLGDLAYAGALAGVQCGLVVYHVLEEPVKDAVPEDVWEDQIGVQSDVLEAEELAQAVAKMREQKPESDGKAESDGQAEAKSKSDGESESKAADNDSGSGSEAEAKADSDDSDSESGSEDGDSDSD